MKPEKFHSKFHSFDFVRVLGKQRVAGKVGIVHQKFRSQKGWVYQLYFKDGAMWDIAERHLEPAEEDQELREAYYRDDPDYDD